MSIGTTELRILKNKLRGPNLKNLIAKRGITKYRIAKDCGIAYQTLLNWLSGRVEPSDENAITVGRYLGIIAAGAAAKEKLKEEIDSLVKKFDALE